MPADVKSGGNLGFEADLWRTGDALRTNMGAAEYKHIILGVIFLRPSSPPSARPSTMPSSPSNAIIHRLKACSPRNTPSPVNFAYRAMDHILEYQNEPGNGYSKARP